MAAHRSDDYYALLGIGADADEAELRRAWRRLALQWHPDRAGPGATATFQSISAAYSVLSDPATRAAYDRKRRASVPPPRPRPSAPPREPVPPPPSETRRKAPGVMLSRLSGALDGLLACGVARRAEGGTIELFLDADEAAQGGMVTISLRVAVRCAACDGSADACARCGSRRITSELFSAWLAVPPGVVDGTVLTPSAMLRGMVRPVSFRVRVDVP